MDEDQIAEFLKVISQIESSGGQNVDHKMMDSGIHAGTAAVGQYGLMPNTVQEVLNRMSQEDQFTPDLQQLKETPPETMREYIATNPEQEDKIAKYLAGRVIDRQGGDQEKAAYSWFQGHNLTPDKIEERGYKDHDYVKKFNKIKGMFGSEEDSGQ